MPTLSGTNSMIAIEISDKTDPIITTLVKNLISQNAACDIINFLVFSKASRETNAINICRKLSSEIGNSWFKKRKLERKPTALINCSYIDPFTAKISLPLTEGENEFLNITFNLNLISIWMSVCEWELIREICWSLVFLGRKKLRALNPRNEWQDINILQLHAIAALSLINEKHALVFWDMAQDGELE